MARLRSAASYAWVTSASRLALSDMAQPSEWSGQWSTDHPGGRPNFHGPRHRRITVPPRHRRSEWGKPRMPWLITKYLITAAVVVAVSEFAKRSDRLGALIA